MRACWIARAASPHHFATCGCASHVADGTPVGYLCWEPPPKEELEAADLSDLPTYLVDIDILIGDPDLLGHGVGSRALELLLARLRAEPSVAFAGLGTSASNTNAIRCFEKAGFRLHREFLDPESGDHAIT